MPYSVSRTRLLSNIYKYLYQMSNMVQTSMLAENMSEFVMCWEGGARREGEWVGTGGPWIESWHGKQVPGEEKFYSNLLVLLIKIETEWNNILSMSTSIVPETKIFSRTFRFACISRWLSLSLCWGMIA